MNLTDHFTLEELTFSDTAERQGIDNTPTPEIIANLRILAHTLEGVRQLLGHPILVSSGYRSWPLNTAIGGSRTSFHPYGLAADFRCPAFGDPLSICFAIAGSHIDFDQLIHEFGRWVHIGLPLAGTEPRRQLLTAKRQNFQTVYVPGLHPITEAA